MRHSEKMNSPTWTDQNKAKICSDSDDSFLVGKQANGSSDLILGKHYKYKHKYIVSGFEHPEFTKARTLTVTLTPDTPIMQPSLLPSECTSNCFMNFNFNVNILL